MKIYNIGPIFALLIWSMDAVAASPTCASDSSKCVKVLQIATANYTCADLSPGCSSNQVILKLNCLVEPYSPVGQPAPPAFGIYDLVLAHKAWERDCIVLVPLDTLGGAVAVSQTDQAEVDKVQDGRLTDLEKGVDNRTTILSDADQLKQIQSLVTEQVSAEVAAALANSKSPSGKPSDKLHSPKKPATQQSKPPIVGQ
jgi:hypothetical protein